MDAAPADRRLGDYLLKEKRGEDALTVTWLAEQSSVSRLVLIGELRPGQNERREEFLADVRAKAAVIHPLTASVYEAVALPDCCYFAYELLPGSSLHQRWRAGEKLKPLQLAQHLRRIAEANLHLETHGFAALPLGLESIFIDDHGVVRLENLVFAGTRNPGESARDIVNLGSALVGLVRAGQPGFTRITLLLAWMRGEGLSAPIGWPEVKSFSEQIELQLAELLPPATAPASLAHGGRRRSFAWLAAGTAFAFAIILVLAMKSRPPVTPPPPPIKRPPAVGIAAGAYPAPDGGEEEQAAFRLATHEVTIGQYSDFLGTLEVLAGDGRETIFDRPDQPAEKVGHEPDDWRLLFSAAKANLSWNGLPVTLATPVVGVDWWDAAAFAEWKKAQLPTQEQWFATLHRELGNLPALQPSPWAPVTHETPDRTPSGIIGLAGSVAEWTREAEVNPANPLGQRLWVIVGGSYLNPASGATTREWTDDRLLRRPDLGFRLVFDPE